MVKQLIEYQHGKLDNFIMSKHFAKDWEGKYIPIVETHIYSYWYVCKRAVIGEEQLFLLKLGEKEAGK